MDRNFRDLMENGKLRVALLAEGVDRNDLGLTAAAIEVVALLAEGVDRNWFFAALFKASK